MRGFDVGDVPAAFVGKKHNVLLKMGITAFKEMKVVLQTLASESLLESLSRNLVDYLLKAKDVRGMSRNNGRNCLMLLFDFRFSVLLL